LLGIYRTIFDCWFVFTDDAIVFNFGLHDTNDAAFDEEARDEFVPLAE
jgi:hypothetical protein